MMATTSRIVKIKNDNKNVVRLIKNNTCVEPKYKICLKIASQPDESGAFSKIPPRVLLIEDVRSYIHYKITEIGDLEMDEAYKKLCEAEGNLKDEHKHLQVKGITNALYFLRDFKTDWIRLVLSRMLD